MAKQNKAYPSEIDVFLLFLVQVAPFLGLGLLAFVLGYKFGSLTPPDARSHIQFIYMVLLISLVTLDAEPGWNLVFFIAFSLIAGILLNWSGTEISRFRTWILFILLLLVLVTGGFYLKRFGKLVNAILFIGPIFYVVGWVFIAGVVVPAVVNHSWIVLGLVLFMLIGTGVIRQTKEHRAENKNISLSIQLLLILFNLFWLSSELVKLTF